MHRHDPTNPREPRRRGLMEPDPQLAAPALDLRTLLWCVAFVLGTVELCHAALG